MPWLSVLCCVWTFWLETKKNPRSSLRVLVARIGFASGVKSACSACTEHICVLGTSRSLYKRPVLSRCVSGGALCWEWIAVGWKQCGDGKQNTHRTWIGRRKGKGQSRQLTEAVRSGMHSPARPLRGLRCGVLSCLRTVTRDSSKDRRTSTGWTRAANDVANAVWFFVHHTTLVGRMERDISIPTSGAGPAELGCCSCGFGPMGCADRNQCVTLQKGGLHSWSNRTIHLCLLHLSVRDTGNIYRCSL